MHTRCTLYVLFPGQLHKGSVLCQCSTAAQPECKFLSLLTLSFQRCKQLLLVQCGGTLVWTTSKRIYCCCCLHVGKVCSQPSVRASWCRTGRQQAAFLCSSTTSGHRRSVEGTIWTVRAGGLQICPLPHVRGCTCIRLQRIHH